MKVFIKDENLTNTVLGSMERSDFLLTGQGECAKGAQESVFFEEPADKILLFHPLVSYDGESLSFDHLLLDERYAEGYLYFPLSVVKQCGGKNRRIPAKQRYEWLLRMAERYPVEGRRPLEGMDAGLGRQKEELSGYRTDCYIAGKYVQRLQELGCFETVIGQLSLWAESSENPEQELQYLEQMIGRSGEYDWIAEGVAPILIYRGVTYCYNILNVIAEQLELGLQRMGERVIVYDEQQEDVAGLSRYAGQRFQAVIGVQSYLLSVYLKQSGCYLHERILGPKFNIVLDHPVWLKNQLEGVPKDYYVLTHDENYRQFIRRYYQKVADSFLFPPGGICQEEAVVQGAERKYDVSFVGTYGDYREKCEALHASARDVRFPANRFLLTMRKDPRLTAEQALQKTTESYGMKQEDSEFFRMLYELRAVIQCVMYYYREKTVRTLLDAGISVEIWGESWKQSPLADHPLLHIHGDVTPEESLAIMRESKLSLNIMAWHKAGFTERMANAMLAGSVVLTDETAYTGYGLSDGKQLVMFQLNHLEELPEKVRGLLEDTDKRTRIARCGHAYAQAHHTWEKRAEQLLQIIDGRKNEERRMVTRIFVMTHKKFYEPKDTVYIPLQVGRVNGPDLGYLGDDTGESISAKNCFYGELTGLYWLWKNDRETGNVGICHYRRFFLNDKKQMMSEQEYDSVLQEYDIITSKAMYAGEPYRQYYGRAHNEQDLILEGEVIRELYPEDYPVFCEVMQGDKHYFGNLMVTSKELFDAYCTWLFGIFSELENRIDVSGYDEYHRRVYGFLSEQLLLVWVTARKLKVYECAVGITEEKAETKEFKLAIGQLLKQGNITEARQMFYEILKIRPDIGLEHSDLKHEIPLLEQILYICELEQAAGRNGMLSYRLDLPALMGHAGKLIELLKKQTPWEEADIRYLKETNVTDIAVEVFARNQAEIALPPEELLARLKSALSAQSQPHKEKIDEA